MLENQHGRVVSAVARDTFIIYHVITIILINILFFFPAHYMITSEVTY